ncbi:uncharacterized protein LOC144521686 [Sander vitreus]
MDTQFKRCTLKSLQSKLCEAYKQSNVTKMTIVSELERVSTASTSGSTGGFRQDDPGLRKWQSLSHLSPEGAPRPFPPSPGKELRAARGESSFRQAEGVQWLQAAHECLDTQLDQLRTRNSQLSYNITTAQLLDMKRKERQKVDTELCKLREALRDAETRAKTHEQERNQALQKLQTSTETQRALLNQVEDMNRKRQNHSEVQEQLSEANNKISQACLEKALLSTQVLKLGHNIKELKAKLTGALSDKDCLIQEKADLHQRAQVLERQLQRAQQGSEGCDTESHNKQDQETVLMKGEFKALKEVNEKLSFELEMIEQKLKTSQSQLQEVTAERDTNSKQITDLEAERSQLITEKEKLLSKINECGHEELTEMKEKCPQLRQSVAVLVLEKQKLQDQCLCLEAEVLEKEEKLHLQDRQHQEKDAVSIQSIEELKAVASHWAEKWQKVALTLQSTQEELEELKKNNSRNELQVETEHLETEIEKLQKEGQKSR